jgi:hypothetical protein
VTDWWFGTFLFFHKKWEESSLTFIYVSEGQVTHQPDDDLGIPLHPQGYSINIPALYRQISRWTMAAGHAWSL